MKVQAKKDLVNRVGSHDFTMGKYYEGKSVRLLENLKVKNDNDENHILGGWAKHFKIISKHF